MITGGAAVAAGAILRLVFLVLHPPDGRIYSDMAGYVSRAEALAGGLHVSPYDAYYPPGTHVLLAGPIWLFGDPHAGLVAAGWLWWLLSSSVPLATWCLARRLVSPGAAALVALLAALDPLLITYGGFFTSETPATAWLVGSLAAGYAASVGAGRRRIWLGAAAGLLGGLAVATRPQLVFSVVVLALALPLRRWSRPAIVAFVCALTVPVAGAVAYDTVASGHLSSISEEGGLNFFLTRCSVHELILYPSRTSSYLFGSPVAVALNRGTDYVYRGVEPWNQSFFYERGLECFSADPAGGIADTARNVADLTVTSTPWPQLNEPTVGRIADVSNIVYCAALLLALLRFAIRGRKLGRLWRDQRRLRLRPTTPLSPTSFLLWQLVTVVLIAIVFGGEPRFRVPYDPLGLILIAAVVDGSERSERLRATTARSE